MRVLVLGCYFPPEIGTTPTMQRDLARGLAGRGHDVTVLVPHPRSYMVARPEDLRCPRRSRDGGVRVLRVFQPRTRRPTLAGRLSEWLVATAILPLRALALGRFEAILVVTPPRTLPAATALLLGRRSRIVVNVQDVYPRTAVDVGLLRNRWAIRFFEAVERFVYRRASCVVIDSERNRAHVLANGARAARIIESWWNAAESLPGPKENAFRRELGLDGRFLVSYGGMLSPHQGLETVLDAAAELSRDERFAFVLAGEGIAKPALVETAKRRGLSNVTFLPYLPPDRYADMIRASDASLVCLAPTVATAVPGKIYSIMSLERPIIAAVPSEGNVPRVLARAGSGLTVPPGDGTALARAIRELGDDPGRAAELGRRGRDYVTRVATLDAALDAYEELIGA